LLISVQQKQSSHFPKLHYALMSKTKSPNRCLEIRQMTARLKTKGIQFRFHESSLWCESK